MATTRATDSSRTSAASAPRGPIGALTAAMGVCFLLCFFRVGWPAAPPPPRTLQGRIDPNRAGWSDLTLLPGIGQVKAETIAAFRRRRREGGDRAVRVFATAADLQAVRGIGSKTVRRIAPYFRFE